MLNRVTNIVNLGGRRRYVKDSKTTEELVGFYQTQPDDYWVLLAKENQEQFKRSLNSKDKNKKASEAREFVVGLPEYAIGNDCAQQLAMMIWQKLGVECIVAIHKKPGNIHAHIIISERELLQEPVHIEAKIAKRNYYYDENGRQCKKANAVKTTLKGTVLQEAHTRYFSDKKNFYKLENIEPFVDHFAKTFNMERFDIEKHFPQRHIGKNNPKEKYIKEYNELVKALNQYFDSKGSEGASKAEFCAKYHIPQRFGVNRIDEVRECFESFKALFETEKIEDVNKLGQEYVNVLKEFKETSADVKMLETGLDEYQSDDYVKQKTGDIKLDKIENKYGEATYELLDELKQTLKELKEKLIELKDKLAGSPAGQKILAAIHQQSPAKSYREKTDDKLL